LESGGEDREEGGGAEKRKGDLSIKSRKQRTGRKEGTISPLFKVSSDSRGYKKTKKRTGAAGAGTSERNRVVQKIWGGG